VAIFIFSQLLQNITYTPFVNSVVEALFKTTIIDASVPVTTGNVAPSSLLAKSDAWEERKMGAVRAGSGGLFGDDDNGVFGSGSDIFESRKSSSSSSGSKEEISLTRRKTITKRKCFFFIVMVKPKFTLTHYQLFSGNTNDTEPC
jgi:hypothetical protein